MGTKQKEHQYDLVFRLRCRVGDLDAATAYMQSFDWLSGLQRTLDTSADLVIQTITWTMLDERHGRVVLVSSHNLSTAQQQTLQRWLYLEMTRGMGVFFDLQDFILNFDAPDERTPSYDDSYSIAFDLRPWMYRFGEVLPRECLGVLPKAHSMTRTLRGVVSLG